MKKKNQRDRILRGEPKEQYLSIVSKVTLGLMYIEF